MESWTRFAPISSEQSNRLRFVVWYFRVSGVLLLAFLLFGLVHAALIPSSEIRAALATNPFGPVIAVAMYGLLLVIAWLLDHRRRAGAVLAAVLLVRPIIAALGNGTLDRVDLALNIIGLVLIVSVWGELRPLAHSGSRPSRAV